MCWGTPAIVIEVDEEGLMAKVDFGDGIVRDVLIGISNDRVSKGDVVIVHAGVIISKLDYKGLREYIEILGEALEDGSRFAQEVYRRILTLAEIIKGGGSG